MAVTALSSSSLLQFITSSDTATPLSSTKSNPLIPLEVAMMPGDPGAQAALDSYTPSSQSQQAANSNSASSASAAAQSDSVISGIPQAVWTIVGNMSDPVAEAWYQLNQSLFVSGDISSAQTALTTYTQALSASDYSMSSATAPTAQFLNDLTTLGSAIQAGSLADAQSTFLTAQQAAPPGVALAYAIANSAAESDGGQAVQGIEATSSLSGVNYGQLSSDIATLDSINAESAANIENALVSQGYSASQAVAYADTITNISSIPTADSTQVVAAQTTQWVQALANYAENGTTPTWFAGAPTPENPMTTVLAGVLEANTIAAWNQRQEQDLVGSTMGASSSSGGTGSNSTSNSGNSAGSTGVNTYA
jgi:hypothetical protein